MDGDPVAEWGQQDSPPEEFLWSRRPRLAWPLSHSRLPPLLRLLILWPPRQGRLEGWRLEDTEGQGGFLTESPEG